MSTNNLEQGAVTVANFNALLHANNLKYRIVPLWRGRDRSGHLQLLHANSGYCIDAEAFTRNSYSWNEATDGVIGTVRTGSPKHLAIKALYARVAARIYDAEPLTQEQELDLFSNYA